MHFQPSLSGALHTARTNAFFMGGGKALVNAYFRSAEALGVKVRYDAPVDALELDNGRFVAARIGSERIEARSCVVASGGFESNREWLREAWGRNDAGEWPADNFLIRGTRFNMGVLLKFLIDAGADVIGDPTQAHMVAIDARAPLYDGGICTRIDCVSLGIVVNRDWRSASTTKARTSGPSATRSGAGWSPSSPGRSATRSSMPRRSAASCRRCFPAGRPTRWPNWRAGSGSPRRCSCALSAEFNAACRVGTFDHATLDDCHTVGLTPAKTHWARPLDTPPFYGYALRPGITFTYLGLKVDERAAVHFGGRPSRQPVRRRRNHGGQRARQGLYGRRRHEHRHRVRSHRRHASRRRRAAGSRPCSRLTR